MYTDKDLENAIEQKIFTQDSVDQFRAHIMQQKDTHIADEENFRLITSFNDIFVVIACILVLASSAWVTYGIHPSLAAMVVAGLSWGLAEFFVLRRKMALPAIFLLLSFVSSLFAAVVASTGERPDQMLFMVAGLLTSIGAWLHWRRFKVPVTVAAGVVALTIFIVSILLSALPALEDYLMYVLLIAGISIFMIAMRWDAADKSRINGKSDVAFWLHLAAAPLIVHPIFKTIGIFEGNESLLNLVAIFALYIVLSLISLVIDRRAFMVSSLIYVLVALKELLDIYGLDSNSFAYVGVFIGFSLLLLSGFWHKTRSFLVNQLPGGIQQNVPSLS